MTNAFPEYDGASDERRERLEGGEEDGEQRDESLARVSDQREQGDQPTAQAEDSADTAATTDTAPTSLNTRARRANQTGARKKAPKRELTPANEPVDITLARAEVTGVSAAHASDEASEVAETEAALLELEAQGFSEDEALRLIVVSGRLASSREARESQATLRRLRFTRWLIERGILDEFSA